MLFRQIVDEKLAQYAYLIGCQQTGEAIIVDPERDIDRYISLAEKENLTIVAAADTHIHADYLTGLREFAERGVRVYASDEGSDDWKYEWLIGSDYDHQLLRHGDRFGVGNIELRAVHTPGHTDEHLSYLVFDHGSGADEAMGIITGDFVFVGDVGRPDLLETVAGMKDVMKSSARLLHGSTARFSELPDFLQVWPGHGAGSACGKALGAVPESTVGYERRFNAALRAARGGQQEFVNFILEGQPEPPPYFARMKRDNRQGPKLLGSIPLPDRITAEDLGILVGREGGAVIDTRSDRKDFLDGHIPGTLYAPMNRSFNTVVGSYVEEGTTIYLILPEERVEEAVRDLIRIGLDDIGGYAPLDVIQEYERMGGQLSQIEATDFRKLEAQVQESDGVIIDVRGKMEYDSGHIAGAVNLAHVRLRPQLDEVPRGRKLFVHCGTGLRSSYAAAFLESNGWDVVMVNDDFGNWQAALETEKQAVSAGPD